MYILPYLYIIVTVYNNIACISYPGFRALFVVYVLCACLSVCLDFHYDIH